VELHWDCAKNDEGQKILPNGAPWMEQLMQMIEDTLFYVAASFSDDDEVKYFCNKHLISQLTSFFQQPGDSKLERVLSSKISKQSLLKEKKEEESRLVVDLMNPKLPPVEEEFAPTFEEFNKPQVMKRSFWAELLQMLINLLTLTPDED
jgi:hypothetical protein